MTTLLAPLAAWAAIVAGQAVSGWITGSPAFRPVVDAWAAAPDWSWAGAFAQAGRLSGIAGLAIGFLLAALGAGDRAARVATRRKPDPVIAVALGLGALSAAAAGLGFAGLLAPALLRLVALAALLAGVDAARARRAELAAAVRSLQAGPVWTATALLAAALLAVALASLPDTHEDPLVYHWAAPEAFLLARRIYPAVQHFQWQWPLGVEMVFAYGLSIGGVAAVKAANLVFLFLTCAAAASIARRLDGRAAGWTAACLVALAPGILFHAWLAKNDPGVGAFWAAAVVAMLAWPARSGRGALVAGVLAGLCASTKYTAAIPLAALAVWFLVRRPGLRAFGLAFGAAAVTAAIWPVRNWLITRDPFYPFGPAFLHGLWWGRPYTSGLHLYARQVIGVAPGGALSRWLAAWRDAFAESGQVGVALAVLSPAALIACLPAGAVLGAVAALGVFLAVLTEWDYRFLLPLAPLTAAGGEIALLRLAGLRPRLAAAAWGILAAAGTLHVAVRIAFQLPPDDWSFLAGRLRGPAYIAARFTVEDELQRWCRDHLPAGDRILLTGSDRRFGFTQPVISSHVVTMPLPSRWARESRTPEELAKKWHQAGIRYIAHNLVSARFRHQSWFTGPPWGYLPLRVYRAFALRYLTEVHRSDHMDYLNGLFYLLRVDRRPHPPAPSIPVLPWTEAIMLEVRVAGNTGAPTPKCLELVDKALAQLPDVDDALETAAYTCAQTGAFERGLALNRAVAAHGFDGEMGWYELAVGESYLGRRAAAMNALRHWAMMAGNIDPRTHDLGAVVFVNLAGARVRAGDDAGACRLLAIALRIKPGFPQALMGVKDLNCWGMIGKP